MKTQWRTWHARAKAAKASSGRPRPDVEIAEAVSEILEADGKTPVKRAVVNHWLNGRRDPSLAEFFALCRVIEADPLEMLFGKPGASVEPLHRQHPDPDVAEVVRLMESTDAAGRAFVRGLVAGHLSSYKPAPRQKGAAK